MASFANDKTEKDRTSFRDFIGVCSVDDVPDARTIWKYREELTRTGAFDELFKCFYGHLQSLGLIVNEGKIIDASFVVSPRQRNTREENKAIKNGEGDSLWNDNPHKKSQKDIDAHWTKKGGESFYGYKDHAKVCRKTKLIVGYDTTPASVHDSQRGAELVDCNDIEGEEFWLDAGYVGTEDGFAKRGVTPIICEKGFGGHPLSDEQKQHNRAKSKVRCCVEHVFGFIERSTGGLVFRGIGIIRAKANVAMTNLTYNMARLAQIFKYHRNWITA